jgi:hypothetical protein
MTSDRPLDELVREHEAVRATAPHVLLAEIEREIRKLSPSRRGNPHWKWLKQTLPGTSQYEMRARAEILLLGAAAAPLWSAIADKYLTWSAAKRIVRKIRHLPGKWDDAGREREIIEALRLHKLHPRKPPMPPVDLQAEDPPEVATARKFWATLRSMVVSYTSQRLVDMEAQERECMIRDLISDLHSTFEHHQSRWSSAVRAVREMTRVTRSQLVDALATLHLDPPRRGKPLDLAVARRAQRELARQYHTDRVQGMEAQYRAVMEAYAIVERWHAENKSQETPLGDDVPHLRVVRGGG